jgi:starch-binding outer membrane protein, SusD/RagB family
MLNFNLKTIIMKKYIITGILGFFLLGCSDLEESPVSVISPDTFIKSTAELQAIVNGSYGLMTAERYWGRSLPLTLLLMSDMCDIGNTATNLERREVNNFSATDTNRMVSGFYPQSYSIIATANQAIDGAKKLTGEDPAKVRAIVAQAYFFRAFTYYNLVRIFGDIPYIDFSVTDISQIDRIFKTKEADVYQKIIADLEFAKANLPDKTTVKAKPSKATAAAYLASVYLTIKNYQKAYDEAKYVINNEALFGLGLEPDFQNLFKSTTALTLKEPLFTIDYNNLEVLDQGRDFMGFLTAINRDETYVATGGFSVAVPSNKVFSTWDQRDYRRAVSFDTVFRAPSATSAPVSILTTLPPGSVGVKRAHIAKYSRFAGPTGLNLRTSSYNYATMRYAEVLLTAAEALNELTPGTAEADGYINRVRARARNKKGVLVSFPPNVTAGLSQVDFRKAVVEERRLELAFEFVRWFDIKRLNIGVEAFGPTGLEPQPNFNPTKHYLLPFPGTEIARNPNLAPNNPF